MRFVCFGLLFVFLQSVSRLMVFQEQGACGLFALFLFLCVLLGVLGFEFPVLHSYSDL